MLQDRFELNVFEIVAVVGVSATGGDTPATIAAEPRRAWRAGSSVDGTDVRKIMACRSIPSGRRFRHITQDSALRRPTFRAGDRGATDSRADLCERDAPLAKHL